MLTSLARRVRSTLRAFPQRVRSSLPFVGVWLVAAVVLATRAAPKSDAATAILRDAPIHAPFARLFHATTGTDSTGVFRAVVVAQRQDCDGNLSIASVLSRRAIAGAVPFRAVLIEGEANDTAAIRDRLPRALRNATVGVLQEDQRRALHAMGHHATPLLLLFDDRGRLRLSAPVSADPVHVTAIRRAIEHLVTNNPLP